MPAGPDERFRVDPTQTGLLLDAVETGFVFTITLVVVEPVQPLMLVTRTVYVPADKVVTPLIGGFCNNDMKPFGPVQE